MSRMKFSVVLPSYNQAKYIKYAVDSVLSQKNVELQLIVVDGGSTDDTIKILREFGSRIILISEVDQGQSDALNKGYELADGEIYGWMNADDAYVEGVFARVESIFKTNPKISVVFGDWIQIDNNNDLIDYQYSFDYNVRQSIFEGDSMNVQSMFWRKAVHKEYGSFPLNLHRTMDHHFIVKLGMLLSSKQFLRLDYPLGYFRRHPHQKTNGSDQISVARELGWILSDLSVNERYNLHLTGLRRIFYRLRRLYWYFRRAGLIYVASKCIKSLKND